MVMEYWTGWFDHWGQKTHSTLPAAKYNATIRQVLNEGGSINQYMFCGGTSFGFMAGSNWNSGKKLALSDTTSYDYDAPLTEYGDWTVKYNITRQIVSEYFPEYLPKNFVFNRPEITAYPKLTKSNIEPLVTLENYLGQNFLIFEPLGYTFESEYVLTMELFPPSQQFYSATSGQAYGYALYQAIVACQDIVQNVSDFPLGRTN